MNNILSHDVPVEEVISKNRYGVRNLEAKYLQYTIHHLGVNIKKCKTLRMHKKW